MKKAVWQRQRPLSGSFLFYQEFKLIKIQFSLGVVKICGRLFHITGPASKKPNQHSLRVHNSVVTLVRLSFLTAA